MTIPNYQEFMNPVLTAFAEIGDEAKIKEIEEKVVSLLNLSNEERAQPIKSGKMTIVANRSYWATLYMTNAGLLERTKRGFYKITLEGINVLNSAQKVNDIFLMKYPSFIEFLGRVGVQSKNKAQSLSETIISDEDPDTKALNAIEDLNSILRDMILEKLRTMDSTRFEYIVKDFMEEMKYGEGKVTQRSNDGGIDVIINEDELGLSKIYLQAKRYATGNNIGRPALQEFSGAMDSYSTAKGVFITTSSFVKTAVEYVESIKSSGKIIILIDGQQLAELMMKHNIGVRLKKGYEVKEIDNSFFDE